MMQSHRGKYNDDGISSMQLNAVVGFEIMKGSTASQTVLSSGVGGAKVAVLLLARKLGAVTEHRVNQHRGQAKPSQMTDYSSINYSMQVGS
jgi:hypothetical protein